MNAFGVYGVGVMGRGIALNVASKGHRVAIFNKEIERVSDVLKDAHTDGISSIAGYHTVKDFMNSLERPKKVLMMVPAGKAVDEVITTMKPYMQQGDIIIDGGNEWYERTEKRQHELLEDHGVHLIGMGVSGGAYGARHGAAFMPGGDQEAVSHILEYIRSASDKKSHVGYVGEGGSGNYVKMVHNGIEYAVMQIIAEAYDIMKNIYNLTNDDIRTFFLSMNTDLQSYLLQITVDILDKLDDDGIHVIDTILDVARMNGTGTWTARDALELLLPCPSIAAAVDARLTSTQKCDRTILSHLLKRGISSYTPNDFIGTPDEIHLKETIITSMYMSYLQGFLLIQKKSEEKAWNVNMNQVAKTWMGGCIIQSTILHFFAVNDPLSYKRQLFHYVSHTFEDYAHVMHMCLQHTLYTPVLSATYQYMLGLTNAKSSANIIQAQRDYFGSHGFEKVNAPGSIHHYTWRS